MKALYYLGDEKMEIRDVPPLKCADDRYLIKVKANGICGSDIEGYLGRSGRRTPPLIMGHEVSGVIEQAPADGRYSCGERVVIFPKPFCGECDYCKKGMVNVCPAGICMGVLTTPGSMVEYIEIEEKYLIPFDSGLSYEIAAMTEPLAVAYRAVYKISDQQLAEANHVMVIGVGTIGLMVLLLLKLRKAKNIIVSDASSYRLDLALQLGADHVINPLEKEVNHYIGYHV
jgi:threonine dehydrogenase-like Zn-dependent dehydrogenase